MVTKAACGLGSAPVVAVANLLTLVPTGGELCKIIIVKDADTRGFSVVYRVEQITVFDDIPEEHSTQHGRACHKRVLSQPFDFLVNT